MLTDEKIIEIIQKHYPCFDIEDDAEMLALEREIEAEAVKAERERILGYLESVNNSQMIESVLTYEINRLRTNKIDF